MNKLTKQFILCLSTSFLANIAHPNTDDSAIPVTSKSIAEIERAYNEKRLKWGILTGKWYGTKKTQSRGTYQWLSERKGDGTYKTIFRETDQSGKLKYEHTTYGEWGVSGNVFFTIRKGGIEGDKAVETDQSDPLTRDAYKIIKLTNDQFVYMDLEEDLLFIAQKVDHGFEFQQ